jgi:ribosomal protein S6--L-glutamate ligase/gamma-F420-2:alpha-L-glutamate ligase
LPKTISSPLCYAQNQQEDERFLQIVANEFDFPIVVKECFGSMGKQVYLASNFEELTSMRNSLKYKPHIYQQFFKASAGVDLRVVVIGKQAVASMVRKSKTDFRSNIELGGSGIEHSLTEKEKAVAEKCAQILGLDYCGVDILIGESEPIVCEVNSNAYFQKLEEVSGVNIAKLYAQHILASVK